MKHMKTIYLPIILLLLTIVSFQNCGGKFKSSNATLSSSSSISNPSQPGSPASNLVPLSGNVASIKANPGDTVNLVIALNAPATQDAPFMYATSDDTAIAGQQYVSKSGSGTIAAGQTTGQITIVTNNVPGLAYLGLDFKIRIQVPSLSLDQTVTVTFISGQAVITLKNQWLPFPAGGTTPAGRSGHTAVWNGSKMIIWGGALADTVNNVFTPIAGGSVYDPSTNTWAALNSVGGPTARASHVSVWTGTEMIVWGGATTLGVNTVAAGDGSIYNPVTGTWSPVSGKGAPSPRYDAVAVWTGTKMIVWGGGTPSGELNDGAMYDPATNTWTPMASKGAPAARMLAVAVWTGSKMIVYGGLQGSTALGDGYAYDPVADTWTPIKGSTPRTAAAAVWSGSKMIVWGGYDPNQTNDGQIYDPVLNTWAAITSNGAPSARGYFSAVWTGTEMIVWGGYPDFNNGGFYF
jgi:N-acetylneuraminic acid mutarotase